MEFKVKLKKFEKKIVIKLKDLLNENTSMGQVHSNPYATSFNTKQMKKMVIQINHLLLES